MTYFPNIQPLGLLTVTAPGTTTALSANCGPLAGGTVGTPSNPPLAGTALRGIVLQAAANTNVGNVYLLPRGSTLAANPGNVMAVIPPTGVPVPFPYGVLLDNGILPENLCLDADTAGNVVYGYGIY
jgi:hypothetical protein